MARRGSWKRRHQRKSLLEKMSPEKIVGWRRSLKNARGSKIENRHTRVIVVLKMSSPSKRREMDVMKLMMSDYTVEMINDGLSEFNVEFHGPKESLYEGGVWKIRVELPDAYPYKSPSVGFVNKIFHPNVDEL
ncbi:hypothetical protein Ahy_B01g054918 isoform B [Arachis hypogaea]|nr:hypothetical protein Ahy_B01g054918 isoform B [Arachis hypogaea]